jgi:hypothetical protein
VGSPFSTKSKGKRLRSGIEKLDLERVVVRCVLLSNELIQTLLGDFSVPLRVGIHPVILSRRFTVDPNAEPDRLAVSRWSQHKMHIAGVESENDLSRSRIETGHLSMICPFAR